LFFTTISDKLIPLNTATRLVERIMDLPHSLAAITFYKQHYFLAWSTKGYAVYDQHFSHMIFCRSKHNNCRTSGSLPGPPAAKTSSGYGTDGNGIIKAVSQNKIIRHHRHSR
jgi:hypothetical protein